jgi:acyl-CoA thioesterase-1
MIVFLIFSACDNGTPASTANTAIDTGVSLICLGDSLTAGHGAVSPGLDDSTKSYPAYLQSKVNIPVINAGISGNTTSQALSRINTDVLAKNPRIVIVELGANDLFQGVPLAVTKSNLQAIINLINDGNRKIYIAKFYTEEVARAMAGAFGINDYNIQTMVIEQYDSIFSTLASSNNVELIHDIWDGVWGVYMSDAVHPNARGYEIMADNYYEAMKPYLQANNLLR